MPIQIITGGLVKINDIDLSDHVQECSIDYGSETQDKTTYADGTRRVIGGLKTWEVSITFLQDYDASKVYATLRPLVGTSACFDIRNVNACSSATNPSINGIGVLSAFSPFGGAVGDALMSEVTFENGSVLTFSTCST